MTEEQRIEHDDEYQNLLALFIALLTSLNSNEMEEALYALSELRTEYAFNHLIKGFDIDYENAMQLLLSKDDSNLTLYEKDLRDRLIVGIENLINFSVCEEYQLYNEVIESVGDGEIDYDSDEYEELLSLCEKYNDNYALIENGDIEYAAVVASSWIKASSADYFVYWTQNDAKVRPWHMELQGYAAHRDEFPSWMIPPIEYNCRCFLQVLEVPFAKADIHQIKGSVKDLKKPKQLSDVYSESLAKCGRIFGPSHSYFAVKEKDKEMLGRFVSRLKEKYYAEA